MATRTPPVTDLALFQAGIAAERKRQAFADSLRLAIARKLSNRTEGSQDEIACALLEGEEQHRFCEGPEGEDGRWRPINF